MIALLIEWLRMLDMHLPSAFDYYSTRAMGSCMTALVLVLALGRPYIKFIQTIGLAQEIRKDECVELWKLHAAKEKTPTMGGGLIIFAVVLSALFWMHLDHLYTWILVFSLISLGLIGGYDDLLKVKYKNTSGLSGRYKLLGQLMISAGISVVLLEGFNLKTVLKVPTIDFFLSGVQNDFGMDIVSSEGTSSLAAFSRTFFLPFFKVPWVMPVFMGSSLLLTFFYCFVITGTSNAVNLSDGLDGLAAGLLILTALPLAVVGFLSDHIFIAEYLNLPHLHGGGEVTVFLSALIGALIGFLWYNSFPAEIFMGDTGSLALGGILGVCAILLRREFFLAIAGGVFVVETLSVILQVYSFKYRNKKRLFLCAPLHHHFEYLGWKEPKVVMRFWICSGLFSLIALISLKLQ